MPPGKLLEGSRNGRRQSGVPNLCGHQLSSAQKVGAGAVLATVQAMLPSMLPCDGPYVNLSSICYQYVINMITYNVMTTRRHGMISLLRSHLVEHGVHVAGFQETRDTKSCMWPGTPYLRFCSAATAKGEGGLQLWISTKLPIATCQGRPIYFEKKQFTVALATPRLMIVHCHIAGLHLTFVVGHAPHSGDSRAPRWWDEFAQHLDAIPNQSHKILFVDANARMHQFNDASVGAHGDHVPATHEDHSHLFHQLLVDHRLRLPSTFEMYHVGDHMTWSIGHRQGSRLDYIAVPQDWGRGTMRSSVVDTIRSGVTDHDHKAVCLQCVLTLDGSTSKFHRRQPIDRCAMTTEAGKAKCRAIFAQMPRIPASTDPTIHCHVFESFCPRHCKTIFD